MKFIQAYFLLLSLSFCQSSYIYFDQNGLNGFTKAFIQTGTLSKDLAFAIDDVIDFKVGTLAIQGLNVTDILIDSNKLQATMNPQFSGINLGIEVDKFLIKTKARVKSFGLTIFNDYLTVQVERTKVSGTLIFGRDETTGALRFSLQNEKLGQFDAGKIQILPGKSWGKQLMAFIANPICNLVLKLLHGKLASVIESQIQSIGQSIPYVITLDGVLQGITIPLSLLETPQIGDDSARFEFNCGQQETKQREDATGYFIASVSQQCVEPILQQIFKIQPSPLNVSAIAQQISDVTEINTNTLSGLFPGFKKLSYPQDVQFEITLDSFDKPIIQFENNKIQLSLPLSAHINLMETQELSQLGISISQKLFLLTSKSYNQVNYNDFNITTEIQLSFVKAPKGFALSLEQIDTRNYKQTEEAYKEDLFNEQNWEDIKGVGLSFAISFGNQVLYQNIINIQGLLDLPQTQLKTKNGELQLILDFTEQ